MDELEQLSPVAYGEYSIAAWELRDKIRARRKELSTVDTSPEAPADAPQPAVDEQPQDDVGAGENLDADDDVAQDVTDVEPRDE